MRFFKIFLIVFFSLVGVCGATYGIMLATGYFDQERIEPEDIYFEQSVYNEVGALDENGNVSFEITIQSSTQDVTEKRVQLSFKNQTLPVVQGRISNGIISIPEKANIGEPFKVYVTQEYMDETGGNWNKGGASTIVARTDIIGVTQAETTINVDVPVYSIKAVAKVNGVEATTFSVNSTFTVEPEFTPALSAYMFGGTETKSVYYAFTTSQGNVNNYIEDLGVIEGKRTFRALMQTEQPITITAYVFNNSEIELENEALYTEEADLIRQASNATFGKSSSVNVNFVTQTIEGFEISSLSNQLPFNKTTRVYANSANEEDYSLGIKVYTSDTSVDMSYKLSDVGIRIVLPEGSNGNEVVVAGYSSMIGVTPEGDVVTGEDIDAAEDTIYYLPTTNTQNMNNSYWTLAANNPSVNFNIEVRVFGNENEFSESFPAEDRVRQTSSWSTAGVVSTSLTWKNEDPVTLKYEDAENEQDIVHRSYNLYNNISITQGSYTTIRYIAYTSVEGENITDMISGVVDNSLFNFTSLFQSYGLGTYASAAEIVDTGEFETKGTGTFNVIAVVIQTNYLGAPILSEDGYYQVVTLVKSQDNPLSNQPLEFTITKTLKTISSYVIASEDVLTRVKGNLSSQELTNYNLNYTIEGAKNALDSSYSSHYAFTGTTETAAFVMEIRIATGDEAIFIDAWNNNEITIQFRNTSTDMLSNVLTYQKLGISVGNIRDLGDGYSAIYVPFIARNVTQDTKVQFELLYQKTESKLETLSCYDYDSPTVQKTFEVYDGNPNKIVFGNTENNGIVTSENSRIEKSIEIEDNGQVEGDGRYIATDISTAYALTGYGGDLESELFNSDGRFNVLVYDKYNNLIGDLTDGTGMVNYAETSSTDEDGNYTVIVRTNVKSSEFSSSTSDYPSATLYFHESQGGYVSRIEYVSDFDGSENREFDIDISFDNEDNVYTSNTIVNMQTIGVEDRMVTLKGAQALFRITYSLNGTEYILYNVTDFEASYIENYSDWLGFNEGGDTLEIRQSFGNSLNFNITASVPELFINQVIGFTVNPAIVLTSSEITPTQTGAESVGENPVYRGVYSDNIINVELTFENYSYASAAGIQVCNENGEAFNTAYSSAIIDNNGNSISLEINFGADKLGQQVVTLYTGGDPNNVGFGFRQNLYFNVTPNRQVEVNGNYTLESDGTYNLGTIYLKGSQSAGVYERIEIYSAADSALLNIVKRLLEETDTDGTLTSFENLNLSFNPTSILPTHETERYFIDNNTATGAFVEIRGELPETETLELYILYGTEGNLTSIAKIKFNVSANVIVPDLSANNGSLQGTSTSGDITHKAFANYNSTQEEDTLHLVLVSGYTYTYNDILYLFNNDAGRLTEGENAGKFNLSFANSSSYVANNETSTISVNSSIVNANQSTFEIVQDGVASIRFNVVIIPGSYEFVKYNTQNDERTDSDYANLINNLNRNIYLLNDMTYLQDEEVYDSYFGGKTYNIYFPEPGSADTEGKPTFGISEYYKNKTNYLFRIVNEDGTSNPNAYATFDSSTGILTTYTYGTEKFIRIECYSGADQTVIFSYRIKIVPNADLNVYYPYIYGANPTGTGVAEYLEFTPNTDIHLNLNEAFAENIPNYREDNGGNPVGKRFALQSQDNGAYVDVETDYTLRFSISSLTVGSSPITGNNISGFASVTQDGNLSIYYLAGTMITVGLHVEAYLGENSLGASADYTVIVGYDYGEFSFRDPDNLSLPFDDSEDPIVIEAESGEEGESGYTLNLNEKVALARIQGGLATKSDLLNFYFYNENQEDSLQFDATRSIITLSDKYENGLVSDLTFKVLLYTRYGANTAYKVLNVVFKSNIQAEIAQTDYVIYGSGTKFTTYSDRKIDLKNVMTLTRTDGDNPTIVWGTSTLVARHYGEITTDITMDEGVISLPQLTSARIYNITLTLSLKDITDPFIYNFTLTVYPNVKTIYDAENPYPHTDNIYANSEETEIVAIESIEADLGGELQPDNSSLFKILDSTGTGYYTNNLGVFVEDGISAIKDAPQIKLIDGVPKLVVTTNAIDNITPVTIRIELTINYVVYNAYVYFEVIPDTSVELNYPTASGEARTAEYIYLPSGADYTINFAKPALFATNNRIVLRDVEEGDFGPTDDKGHTVAIRLGGTNWQRYIVPDNANDGEGIPEGESYTLTSTSIKLKWKEGVSSVNSLDLSFVIIIDGIERDTYTVRVDKNLGNVYGAEVNYFGDTEVASDGQEYEIFILNDNEDAIFSANYQRLTFIGKSDLADGTIISANDIGGNFAEISIDNGATFNTSVTLDSTYRNTQVKLIMRFTELGDTPTERIDPYGNATDDNTFAKYFTISGNRNFSDIATVGTAEVVTRISVYYRGDLVDYSKYSDGALSASGVSGGLDDIALDLSEPTSNSKMDFNLESVTGTFVTYGYKAVFDFKIGNGKSASQGYIEVEANESLTGVLGVSGESNIWEITKYNGQNYPQDYFAPEQNRSITMSLYLVADTDYDYTQFDENGDFSSDSIIYWAGDDEATLRYPPSRVLPVQMPYTTGSGSNQTTSYYTYDFNINADGAKNQGNYVVYKVTYTVQISDTESQSVSEYIMLKVMPDWQYSLRNGEGATSTQNSESTPLYIYYTGKGGLSPTDSEAELPLTLARTGSTSRVVLTHTNGQDTSNQATDFTYTLSPSLQNYLTLSSTGSNVIQFEKGALTANYGDINGYIDITDEFGYTLRYYVVLKANTTSTNIALIIDSEGSQVLGSEIWEGSSIYLLDYNTYVNDWATTERRSNLADIGADYYILISGYGETFNDSTAPAATFTALNSDGTNSDSIEKAEIEENDENYTKYANRLAEFRVMNTAFYSGALSVPLTLQIELTINKGNTEEQVLISTNIYLRQRYATTISSANSNNVLDNEDFDVSNFINISDRKIGDNLGNATVGNYDYSIDLSGVNLESGSLEVRVELSRPGVTATTGVLTIPSSELNGQGGQYFFLSDFEGFESVDFSQYDLNNENTYIRILSFAITGSTNSNNTPIMYTYQSTSRGVTTESIIVLNPTTQPLYLQATANVNNENITFVYGSSQIKKEEVAGTEDTKETYVVTPTAIPSSAASTRITFSSSNFVTKKEEDKSKVENYNYLPDKLTVELYESTELTTPYSNQFDLTDKIKKDKKVSLNTMDVVSTNTADETAEENNVLLNVRTNYGVKQVKFTLNYDGTQAKSLRYETGFTDIQLDDETNGVWTFTLSDMPLTSEDLLKVKATTIYSDTITLSIPKGFVSGARRQLSISVSSNGENLTTTPYVVNVTETYAHYIHIPLSTIIGKSTFTEDDIFTKDDEGKIVYDDEGNPIYKNYSVTITHDNLNTQITYVPLNDNTDGSKNITSSVNGNVASLTISNFNILELEQEDNIAARDVLDVLSVSQFNTATKTTLTSIYKNYITKFAKSELYNSNSIGYTVTPNPYGVDTSGNTGTLSYKQIDAAACEPSGEPTVYTISADMWTQGFQVVGRSGDVISLLNYYFSLGDKIFFEINTDDEQIPGGFGAGLATINSKGTITTDPSFDITTNAISISIRAYVDKTTDRANSIEVGTVALVLTENTLTAPSVGNYTIQRKSTGLSSTGAVVETLYESLNYTVNSPNDRVIDINELDFPVRSSTDSIASWRYNYTLIELFQSGTIINANSNDTSKIDIALRTINDRTSLRNREVTATIQAVSKTTGEVLTSIPIMFKFDGNGYKLKVGEVQSSASYDEFETLTGSEVNGDIGNYEYDITLALSTIFTGQDSIITGLNYDYSLIVTDYSSTAGGNIIIEDMVISDIDEVNSIFVFEVTAYGTRTNSDGTRTNSNAEEEIATKYLGFISDEPLTAGGVALDLRSAFSEYYNTSSGVQIKRFETSNTGLTLPILSDTFAEIGYDQDATEKFITPSLDTGNTAPGVKHSWVLEARRDTEIAYYTAYYNLINVSLKYKQSFVIEGTGNFTNTLSPYSEIENDYGVNINDLIAYRTPNAVSNYTYTLKENVSYKTINTFDENGIVVNTLDEEGNIVNTFPTGIVNTYQTLTLATASMPTRYSFYKLGYRGTRGSTESARYIVDNGTETSVSRLNLADVGKTGHQEIVINYYRFVTVSDNSIMNGADVGSHFLLNESYEDGDRNKVQFIEIAAKYKDTVFETTSNSPDFITNIGNTGSVIGESSRMYAGTSITLDAGSIYSLEVIPRTWSDSYNYYIYTADKTQIQLHVFTPTGLETKPLGDQTVDALYEEGYSYVYSDTGIDLAKLSGTNYIFISRNGNATTFKQFSSNLAIDGTQTKYGWYYFTGLDESSITNITSVQAERNLNLTAGYIYSFDPEGDSQNDLQYFYLSEGTLNLDQVYYENGNLRYADGTVTAIKQANITDSTLAAYHTSNNVTTVNLFSTISTGFGDGYRLDADSQTFQNADNIGTTISLGSGYYEITGNGQSKYIYVKADSSISVTDLFKFGTQNPTSGQTYTITKHENVKDDDNVFAYAAKNDYILYKDNSADDLTYSFVVVNEAYTNYIELNKNIANSKILSRNYLNENSIGVYDLDITLPEAGRYKITQKDNETPKYITLQEGNLTIYLNDYFDININSGNGFETSYIIEKVEDSQETT